MSCSTSSWRLYPERSITPHSIVERAIISWIESRRDEQNGWLMIPKDRSYPERGQDYSLISVSRQFSRMPNSRICSALPVLLGMTTECDHFRTPAVYPASPSGVSRAPSQPPFTDHRFDRKSIREQCFWWRRMAAL